MITGPIREILISGEPTVPSQNWRQSMGEEVWVCEGLLIQTQNGSFPHLRSPDHINLNLSRTRNSPQVRVHEYLCKVQTKKLNRGGKNIQSKHRSQSEVLRSYDDQSNPASQSKPPQTQNGSFPHLRSPDHINLNLWRTRNSPQVRVHEYLCKVQTKKLNRGGKNIQSKDRSLSEVVRSYDDQSNPASQSKPPGFSSSVQNDQTSVQINLNVQILFL